VLRYFSPESGASVTTRASGPSRSAARIAATTFAPEDLPSVAAFLEAEHGEPVLIVAAIHAGSLDQGERALRPFRELGELLFDLSSPIPWTSLQQMFDPFYPAYAMRYYWKSIYLDELNENVIEAIDDWARNRPSPDSNAILWALGGALSATAAGKPLERTTAAYQLEILSNWREPERDEVNVQWARDFYDAMLPFTSGKPNVNFPGLGEDSDSFVRAAYGAHYQQLVAAKNKYDPTNLFRLNQNIAPRK
jgi:hypothetical protein